MVYAVDVGPGYRDMKSVRKWVSRNCRGNLIRVITSRTQGNSLVYLTATRAGCRVQEVTRNGELGDAANYAANVELVKEAEGVVVFDDGSNLSEHVYNVASVNKKQVHRFREV